MKGDVMDKSRESDDRKIALKALRETKGFG